MRERRMEKALSWAGAGTIAGALLLAVVAAVLHWAGDQDTGVLEEAGMGWFWVCLLGAFVLILGVRRQTVRPDEAPDAESGWDYPLCLAGAAAVTALIAGNGALLGADAPEVGGLSPTELRMAIVVCAVPVGILLMLTVVRRPLLPPRARSLPSFGAGALAVILAGTALPLLFGGEDRTGIRHVVAEDPPEKVAVPEQVRRSGWTWELEQNPDSDPESDEEVEVERIVRGAHGPLVVLSDGVVSLDGTDGTEVWSYRRFAGEEISVWSGHGSVYVTHTPVVPADSDDTEVAPVTEEFDLVTGELLAEYTNLSEERPEGDTGNLIGWSDGIRVHHDWRAEREGDQPSGVSAWDGESGAELWHRPLTPEEDSFCDGGTPRVLADTVVYAAVCVSKDDVYEQKQPVRNLVWDGDVHTEFRVVSVDLRTGQEQWSYERDGWEEVFVPNHMRAAWGEETRGDALVVMESWSGTRGLLLDPDSGEELMRFTDDLLEFDEEFSAKEVLDADGSGVTVRYEHRSQGAEVHRVDATGGRTELVGAGGARISIATSSVQLAKQFLSTENPDSEYENRASVLVAAHGERMGEGLHNRIVLESRGSSEQIVTVPGGVAVLVREFGSGVRVEGLVP